MLQTGALARPNQAHTKEGTGGGGKGGMEGLGVWGFSGSRGTPLQLGRKTMWPFGVHTGL